GQQCAFRQDAVHVSKMYRDELDVWTQTAQVVQAALERPHLHAVATRAFRKDDQQLIRAKRRCDLLDTLPRGGDDHLLVVRPVLTASVDEDGAKDVRCKIATQPV